MPVPHFRSVEREYPARFWKAQIYFDTCYPYQGDLTRQVRPDPAYPDIFGDTDKIARLLWV